MERGRFFLLTWALTLKITEADNLKKRICWQLTFRSAPNVIKVATGVAYSHNYGRNYVQCYKTLLRLYALPPGASSGVAYVRRPHAASGGVKITRVAA